MSGMLLPANAITVVRGSSKTLELTVLDESNKPVNLTGASVHFTVKEKMDSKNPLIYKNSYDPTKIEITNPRSGVARIYLVPVDTQTLDAKDFVFDAWVVLATGKRYPVVQPSVFVVAAGVTVLSV